SRKRVEDRVVARTVNFEDRATTMSFSACLSSDAGHAIQISLRVGNQVSGWASPAGTAIEVEQYGFFAAGVEFEDGSATVDIGKVRAAKIRGAVEIARSIQHPPAERIASVGAVREGIENRKCLREGGSGEKHDAERKFVQHDSNLPSECEHEISTDRGLGQSEKEGSLPSGSRERGYVPRSSLEIVPDPAPSKFV